MFIINNAIFRCQSKGKVLSSNTFGRMQVWNKMENLIIDELEASSSDDETDTDSDNDDEFDNKKYNVESNE